MSQGQGSTVVTAQAQMSEREKIAALSDTHTANLMHGREMLKGVCCGPRILHEFDERNMKWAGEARSKG